MNTSLSNAQIMDMEQRKRAQLINSTSGFRSVALIGTIDTKGQTNLAIFNSIVHIGSNPPLLGFIMRPDSVERHTLSNIMGTGYYTINHIHQKMYEQAHQTSARYPKSEDGFLDIEKAGTITSAGLDSYHTTQVLKRLEYAKP